MLCMRLSAEEVYYTATGVGGRQSAAPRAHFTNNETSDGATPISHMDGISDWKHMFVLMYNYEQ